MCAFTRGRSPAGVARAAIVPLLFAAASLGEAGCASSQNPSYANAPAVAAYSRQVASQVHIEDDGLPSQVAPVAHIRQMPDDPSEPFSRNYGGPNPAAVEPKEISDGASKTAALKPEIPPDLPPAFRTKLAQAGYVVE
jgi:hypothetical protein